MTIDRRDLEVANARRDDELISVLGDYLRGETPPARSSALTLDVIAGKWRCAILCELKGFWSLVFDVSRAHIQATKDACSVRSLISVFRIM